MRNDTEAAVLVASQQVTIGGKTFTVRELDFASSMRFMEMLGEAFAEFAGAEMASGPTTPALTASRIVTMIHRNAPIAGFLLEAGTGMVREELDRLPMRVAIKLLDEIIAVNFTEELLGNFRALAGRLGAMATPQKTAG